MGVAFWLFALLSGFEGKTVPVLAVFAVLGGFAISELLLSPIGLAVTTHLAPAAFRSQMMALYFFSVGIGTSMAGTLARYYSPDSEIAYFGISGAAAIAAGLVVIACAPWIKRHMQGVH